MGNDPLVPCLPADRKVQGKMMNKNIALVGFMGTGKTTIARRLAVELKADYIDLDDLIEDKEGMKIVEIFKLKGEAYFRKVEKEIVSNISSQAGKVIACGGGVVLDEENVKNLKNNGLLICLRAKADVILERTKNYRHRPLLNAADKKAKVEELLHRREPFYARADFSLDTSCLSEEEVVDKILAWIKDRI